MSEEMVVEKSGLRFVRSAMAKGPIGGRTLFIENISDKNINQIILVKFKSISGSESYSRPVTVDINVGQRIAACSDRLIQQGEAFSFANEFDFFGTPIDLSELGINPSANNFFEVFGLDLDGQDLMSNELHEVLDLWRSREEESVKVAMQEYESHKHPVSEMNVSGGIARLRCIEQAYAQAMTATVFTMIESMIYRHLGELQSLVDQGNHQTDHPRRAWAIGLLQTERWDKADKAFWDPDYPWGQKGLPPSTPVHAKRIMGKLANYAWILNSCALPWPFDADTTAFLCALLTYRNKILHEGWALRPESIHKLANFSEQNGPEIASWFQINKDSQGEAQDVCLRNLFWESAVKCLKAFRASIIESVKSYRSK